MDIQKNPEVIKMKSLSYIPIALFVLVNTVYDFFYVPKCTEWSIFYFAGTYTSLLIWTIVEAIRGDVYEKIYFIAMSLGMSARIAIELSKIGMDYDKYMISINDKEKALLFIFLTFASLSLVVHKLYNGNNKRNC